MNPDAAKFRTMAASADPAGVPWSRRKARYRTYPRLSIGLFIVRLVLPDLFLYGSEMELFHSSDYEARALTATSNEKLFCFELRARRRLSR